MPYFSLIVATLNRLEENLLLLDSLKKQTFQDFELIIVDQNPGDELKDAIKKHTDFPLLTYLHPAESIGLSAARNLGIKEATGQILAFPDDDCWYQTETLQKVKIYFEKHDKLACLTGLVTAPDGRFSAGGHMLRKKSVEVNSRNVWTCSNSSAIFARRSALEQIGTFDTQVGLGTERYISGEESDLVLRIERSGQQVHYSPHIHVFHHAYQGKYKKAERQKGFGYGLGMGYILRKQGYGFFQVMYYAGIHVAKGGFMMATLRFQRGLFHWAQALGRMKGWFEYGKQR